MLPSKGHISAHCDLTAINEYILRPARISVTYFDDSLCVVQSPAGSSPPFEVPREVVLIMIYDKVRTRISSNLVLKFLSHAALKKIFYQFSPVLLLYCTIILAESAVLSLYILIELYLSCPVWNKFHQIRVCHTYMDICGMSRSAQERDFIVKTRESHLSVIG